MAYDIYGNTLRPGYCEVHPHVNQEYPCSLCYAEDNIRSRDKDVRSTEYEAHYREDMMQTRIDDLTAESQELTTRLHNLLNAVEALIEDGFVPDGHDAISSYFDAKETIKKVIP